MKTKLFYLFAMLLIAATSATAQTGDIVTMKTAADKITIAAVWTGTGTITANGVPLKNNLLTPSDDITPDDNGIVVLTATDNVQLTQLNIPNRELESLDVAKCTALTDLYCHTNSLTSLDVTKCTALTILACHTNTLTLLDVSKCMALTDLYCHTNSLTELDVTQCTKLTFLQCYVNKLSKLDVTNCPELTNLDCYQNALTTLDVSACPKLATLNCFQNALATLDLSGCSVLSQFNAQGQQIEVPVSSDATTFANPILYKSPTVTEPITVGLTQYAKGDEIPGLLGDKCNFSTTNPIGSGNPFSGIITMKRPAPATMKTTAGKIQIRAAWTGFGAIAANGTPLVNNVYSGDITPDANGMVVLTATSVVQLTVLNVSECSLESLDVSNSPQLTTLHCADNLLTELDVTNCPELTTLICSVNSLTGLNVTNCTKLESLSCFDNSLAELDLSKCAALQDVYCNNNALTELNVANCTELIYLQCHANSLAELNVSSCSKLRGLQCASNSLTMLDFSGCNDLEELEADGQQIEIDATVLLENAIFANPILYKNKTAIESVTIDGIGYAKDANIPIPISGEVAFTTAKAITTGEPFGGTITINATYMAAVTFDQQNGTPANTEQVEINATVPAPTNPTRTGFTFNGWFTVASGGEKVVFPYTATASVTFYAQWSPIISVSEAEAEVLTVYSIPGSIVVSGIAVGELITVYSSSGVQVAVVAAQNDTTFISLASLGLYIVKAGEKTAKVVKN